MKISGCSRAMLLVAVAAGLAASGWAQQAAVLVSAPDAEAPRPMRPLVHPDGTTTFSFVAQNARDVKVQIEGQAQPAEMKRGTAGVWTYTSGVMAPELYGYSYIVDGVQVADPANQWHTANLLYAESLLEVPGRRPGPLWEPWDQTDVPHGVVTHFFYRSAAVGDERDYFVYTPPGYDARGSEKYPVLYLLHGYSDGADVWTAMGQANFILDNLIAQGKAKPMIVVMPLAYGDPSILGPTPTPRPFSELWPNDTKFKAALLTEMIPAVEREYRVKSGPENTAIAGLSMGGRQALYVGVSEPQKFGYVVAMSPAPVPVGDASGGWQWKANRELLWIGCGSEDNLVGRANRELDAYLKAQGVKATIVWTPGMHTWMVWRENLVAFAPLLFR